MPFLTGVNQLRKIEWSKSFLWDIKFDEAPPPFDQWFPAIEVDQGLFDIESQDFTTHVTTFRVPKSTNSLDVSITFVDDINHTLLEWFEEWATSMFTEGKRVKTVGNPDVSKKLEILRLDTKRQELRMDTLFVYLNSKLSFTGNSQSEIPVHTVDFVIVAKKGVFLKKLPQVKIGRIKETPLGRTRATKIQDLVPGINEGITRIRSVF